MPAVSQQQQKLFGLALSVKRGETPRSEASEEVLNIVDSMSEKDIKDFAENSHSGLPSKVEQQMREALRELMREMAIEEAELPQATIPANIKTKLVQAIDKIKDTNLNYNQKLQVIGKIVDSLGIDKKELAKMSSKLKTTLESLNEADPCWKGYQQIGMKKKNGKEVPNCVPESIQEGKKRFNTKYGVGSSKYVISYHDGSKKHKDGSDFFDIQIFKNQKDLDTFKKALLQKGFIEESVNEAWASGPYVGIENTPTGPKLVKTFNSGSKAYAWVMKAGGGHSIMTQKQWNLEESVNEAIAVGKMVKVVDNPHWEAALGKKGPFKRKVKMIDHDTVFFTDGSNSSMKYVKESVNEISYDSQGNLKAKKQYKSLSDYEKVAKKGDFIWIGQNPKDFQGVDKALLYKVVDKDSEGNAVLAPFNRKGKYTIPQKNQVVVVVEGVVNEANYKVYHKSFTEAAQEARMMAEKRGFEINEDDWHSQITLGGKNLRSRPGEGKTTTFTVGLSKDGKPQRKALQIQVYGMKNGYELNAYIN